jgi:hypothetical protein
MPGAWLNAAEDPDFYDTVIKTSGTLLQFAAYGTDRVTGQGDAILRISEKYRDTQAGCFLGGVVVAASDGEYLPWAKEHEGAGGMYHFCRGPLGSCRAVFAGKETEHFSRVRNVEESDLEAKNMSGTFRMPWAASRMASIREARENDKAMERDEGGVPGDEAGGGFLEEVPLRDIGGRGKGKAAGRRGGRGAGRVGGGKPALADGLEVVAGAGGADAGDPGGAELDPDDDLAAGERTLDQELAALESAISPPDVGSETRKDMLMGKLQTLKRKIEGGSGTADATSPQPKKRSALQESLAKKGLSLPGAGSPSGVGNPGGLGGAPGGAGSSSGDGLPGQDDALHQLVKLLKRGNSGGGLDALDDEDKAWGSSIENKRALFRQIARTRPGELTTRGLETLRGYMSSLGGGNISGDPSAPIVLHYLLTIFFAQHPPQSLGEETARELRTLAEALDGLLKGEVIQVLDLLMQRFKATTLAAVEGSTRASRWLELIPTSTEMVASPEELEVAKRAEAGELKLKALVKAEGAGAGR